MDAVVQPKVQQKVVVGLGQTGQACARFLKEQGYDVTVVDSRATPPNYDALKQDFPDIEFRLGGLDQATLCNAGEIVVSPGVSLHEPALQSALDAGVPIIGDIELFRRYVSEPVIAITGSNAKSTVTTLVGDMLRDAGYDAIVAGNIGVPVMDVLNARRSAEMYVLELSSFQLETTSNLKAQVATILNISADHMDRYDSLESYVEAKQRIYMGAENIVHLCGDPFTAPRDASNNDRNVFQFTSTEPDHHQFGLRLIDGEQWLAFEEVLILPTAALRIKGKHNYMNALAALALGYCVGLTFEQMAKTLRGFSGLPHRCQHVAVHNNIDFYNDSKGTNVGATLAAIEGIGPEIEGQIVLLAGGNGKGADFKELAPAITRHVRHIVLIGRDAKRMARELNGAAEISFAASMLDAVSQCIEHAHEGDAVLLSPACASFDMFNGFEDRGVKFVTAVESQIACLQKGAC